MNTHWIDYLPGGVARVTDKEPVDTWLKTTKAKDVNRLSRIIVKFNMWLTTGGYIYNSNEKFDKLEEMFQIL